VNPTTDGFETLLTTVSTDDERVALGDALADLAVDVGVDAVAPLRDVRERL